MTAPLLATNATTNATTNTATATAEASALQARWLAVQDLANHYDNNTALQQALDLLQDPQLPAHPALQVRTLALASMLAARKNQLADAARFAATAMTLSADLPDHNARAHAQVAAARVSWTVGDNDAALAELEAAWPQVERGADAWLRAHCENMLGMVVSQIGQPETAMAWHLRAQHDAAAAQMPHFPAVQAANAAGRWLEVGDQRDADGDTAGARQAWLTAVTANDSAEAFAQRSGTQRTQVLIHANRGAALARLGQAAAARHDLEQARSLAEAVDDTSTAAETAGNIAKLLLSQGDAPAAMTEALRGVAIASAAGIKTPLPALHVLLSAICEATGDLRGALQHHKRFHALGDEMALARAQLRAELMAVRLETQTALAAATQQRERADHLAQANAVLTEQVLQDPLTGLANRRGLDIHLTAALADALARDVPLCVAMLDIDHFKQVNDGFSHAVGDQVLVQFGSLLRTHSRQHDVSARVGGEEFILVIPHVGLARAVAVCERLRAAVQAHDWHSVAPGLVVTVSIGLCDVTESPDLAAGLAQADQRLYAAKAAGRNRVVAVEPAID